MNEIDLLKEIFSNDEKEEEKEQEEKKKLTSAQREAKRKRRMEYMTVFMNGKQKSIRRPETIDGMGVDGMIVDSPQQ